MNIQSGKTKNRVLTIIRRIIIIVLICVCIVLFLLIQIYPGIFSLGIKTHKTQDYFDGKYSQFRGGKIACKFLPEPDELGDYESLDLYYVNNVLKTSIFYGRYGNTFMLDVCYDEKSFDAAVVNLFSLYKCPDLFKEHKLDLFWLWDYYVVEFKPGAIDDENSFFICINEKEYNIRFLFLENGHIYYTYRMISDFDMDSWDTKISVRDPDYVESVKEKYDSYIISRDPS